MFGCHCGCFRSLRYGVRPHQACPHPTEYGDRGSALAPLSHFERSAIPASHLFAKIKTARRMSSTLVLTPSVSSFIVSNNRRQALLRRWKTVFTTTVPLGGVRSGQVFDKCFRIYSAREAAQVGYRA
jgi:hypothetical protein